MFYYLFHHVNHMDGKDMNDVDYDHGGRNVRTFLMGSVSYIFLAAFLYSSQYQTLISSFFVLFAIRDWLLWFIAADVLAMAVKFKHYFGFSILREGKDALVEKSDSDAYERQITSK